ncbi:MAG: hypothetical protein GF355_09590 [Candidatus Eisenbacteria bacterium]|nr:hypothetical protein [Candidatus Eisenbacteria bacterium]
MQRDETERRPKSEEELLRWETRLADRKRALDAREEEIVASEQRAETIETDLRTRRVQLDNALSEARSQQEAAKRSHHDTQAAKAGYESAMRGCEVKRMEYERKTSDTSIMQERLRKEFEEVRRKMAIAEQDRQARARAEAAAEKARIDADNANRNTETFKRRLAERDAQASRSEAEMRRQFQKEMSATRKGHERKIHALDAEITRLRAENDRLRDQGGTGKSGLSGGIRPMKLFGAILLAILLSGPASAVSPFAYFDADSVQDDCGEPRVERFGDADHPKSLLPGQTSAAMMVRASDTAGALEGQTPKIVDFRIWRREVATAKCTLSVWSTGTGQSEDALHKIFHMDKNTGELRLPIIIDSLMINVGSTATGGNDWTFIAQIDYWDSVKLKRAHRFGSPYEFFAFKKISTGQMDVDAAPGNDIKVAAVDMIPWAGNPKIVYIRLMHGTSGGSVEIPAVKVYSSASGWSGPIAQWDASDADVPHIAIEGIMADSVNVCSLCIPNSHLQAVVCAAP